MLHTNARRSGDSALRCGDQQRPQQARPACAELLGRSGKGVGGAHQWKVCAMSLQKPTGSSMERLYMTSYSSRDRTLATSEKA